MWIKSLATLEFTSGIVQTHRKMRNPEPLRHHRIPPIHRHAPRALPDENLAVPQPRMHQFQPMLQRTVPARAEVMAPEIFRRDRLEPLPPATLRLKNSKIGKQRQV